MKIGNLILLAVTAGLLIAAIYLSVLGYTSLEGELLEMKEIAASGSWPTADAVITKSELTTHLDAKKRKSFSADIAYKYTVDGKDYSSERISSGGLTEQRLADSELPEGLAKAFAVGTHHEVHFSPKDPAKSVLVPGLDVENYHMQSAGNLFGGLLFAIMFVLVLVVMRPWSDGERESMSEIRRSKTVFAVLAMVLGFSFIVVSIMGQRMIIKAHIPPAHRLEMVPDGYYLGGVDKKIPY